MSVYLSFLEKIHSTLAPTLVFALCASFLFHSKSAESETIFLRINQHDLNKVRIKAVVKLAQVNGC